MAVEPRPRAGAPAIDLPGLRERLGVDDDDVANLLASFLREAPKEIACVEAALSARDVRDVERTVHRLKGSLAWISAPAASALMAEMERLAWSGDLDSASGLFPDLVRELDCVFAEAREATAARP